MKSCVDLPSEQMDTEYKRRNLRVTFEEFLTGTFIARNTSTSVFEHILLSTKSRVTTTLQDAGRSTGHN